MLKINQEAWYEMYQKYDELIIILDDEADYQSGISDNSIDFFKGLTAETMRYAMKAFYTHGLGYQFRTKAEAMRDYYKGALTEIVSIQTYCDQIVDTLLEDDHNCVYKQEYDFAEGDFTGKTLFCNRNLTSEILNCCDQALSATDTLYENLSRCIYNAGLDDEIPNLQSAHNILGRLQYFKWAIQYYDMMITDFINDSTRILATFNTLLFSKKMELI